MDDLLTHSHRRFICFIAHFVLCIAALAHTSFAHAATVITYFHNDAANTPVVATNENGAVVWRETHLPYGERFSKQANVNAHPLQFTGKSEDPDTGLIDEGARQYDPITAQFTGFDPAPVDINDPRGFTRYGYANNNPYRYSDPNGESPVDIAFLAADTLKLGLAIYSGNAAAIRTAAVDFAVSAVGVVDPLPFTGEALKAAVFAKRVEATAKSTGYASKEIRLSRNLHGEAATHAKDAIRGGKPDVLTIERNSASANRRASTGSLENVPGKHLDEYPPAMFKEGGSGASVRPISPRDNMSAGACIGNACRGLPNGSRIKITIGD